MLRRPFHKQYRLTQGFGDNPADYARFGLKGHNGLDYALPHGTELVSPIDGKVTEVGNDTTGYGGYVKVENDAEGHLTGHMSRIDVQVGQEVYEGQTIGLSGGTKGSWGAGNTTGAHLHWGRFPKPRNRDNGYSGYENQADLLISWDDQLKLPTGRTYINKPQNQTIPVDALEFPKLVNKATKWDETVRQGLKSQRPSEEVNAQEVIELIQKLTAERDDLIRRIQNIKQENVDGQTVGYYITELSNRTEQVTRLKTELKDLQGTYEKLKAELVKGYEVEQALRKAEKERADKLLATIDEQGKTIGKLKHDIDEANTAKHQAENEVVRLTEALEVEKNRPTAEISAYEALELLFIRIVQALKNIKLK